MPTFQGGHPWYWYVLWNLGAFAVAFFPHSIVEWIAHRFLLHSKALVRFAYEEHDQRHHERFGHDASFAVSGTEYGRDFNVRDWFLFLIFIMPLWAGLEWGIGKPILLGTFAAACVYLHAFNVIHRHFHAPTGGWLERRAFYSFLREHHRLHHRVRHRNLNVVFPLADLLLGTRLSRPR